MSMCRVCGGDIKGGYCTSCGMSYSEDQNLQGNNLNNKYYQNTQSNNTYNNSQNPGGFGQRKKKKSPIIILVILFTVFVVIGGVVGFVSDIISSALGYDSVLSFEEEYDYNDYDEDYGYDEDYSDEKEENIILGDNDYMATLGSGAYIVGLHIPAGIYDIEMADKDSYNWGYIVVNRDGGNNFYEGFDEETGLYEVELLEGDGVSLETSALANFTTSTASPLTEGTQNPLTESVLVKERENLIAGIDFPAGTYDIYILYNDYGSVDIDIYDDFYGNQESYYNFYGDMSEELEPIRNIEFPTGTKIETDDMEVELVPSEYDTILESFDFEENYVEVNKIVNERLIAQNYIRQSEDKPLMTQGEENLK